MLLVTNRNGFPFDGRYDGVDYHFPVGAKVAVPEDAARHIFGVGESDKTAVLVRHGWLKSQADQEAAMGKLNGFSFDVSSNVAAGEVVSPGSSEQGSAPLHGKAGATPDGVASAQPSIPASGKGGSILDELGG